MGSNRVGDFPLEDAGVVATGRVEVGVVLGEADLSDVGRVALAFNKLRVRLSARVPEHLNQALVVC